MLAQRVDYAAKQPEKVQTKDLVWRIVWNIWIDFGIEQSTVLIERIDVQNKVNIMNHIKDMYLNYSMR